MIDSKKYEDVSSWDVSNDDVIKIYINISGIKDVKPVVQRKGQSYFQSLPSDLAKFIVVNYFNYQKINNYILSIFCI